MGQAAPACWTCEPAGGADAPAVAGFEAGEAILRHGGAEVVAESFGGFEEGGVDDAADGVDAVVVGAGLAAAGAVEAGHGLAAADVEGLAEDVFAAVFDGFDGGHGLVSSSRFDGLQDCQLQVAGWPVVQAI